ncbi:MAG TPA: GAF domain-containing protein [Syntrophorhabdaceae bacterium]|nr:GAF domain-containing protein [Syntrophorhabdaceae bacterium]HQM80103.1 GAF domain-containing protein [Syntrophorhabdaceae bacterium]
MSALLEGKRIYAAIITFIFVATFFVTFIMIRHHYELAVKQIIDENRSKARFFSMLMSEHQKAAISILESYAQRPLLIDAIKAKSLDRAIPHLRSLRERYAGTDALFITDPSGTLWANYPVDKTGYRRNLAYRDWYKGVSRSWQPYVSSVFRLIVLEKGLGIALSVPVFDRGGKVVGILSNAQRTSFFVNLLSEGMSGPEKEVFLLDQEGNIIYTDAVPYEGEIVKYPDERIRVKAVAGDSFDMEAEDAGEKGTTSYVSVAPLKGIGWSVIVAHDKDAALKTLYGHFVLTAATGFLIFLMLSVTLLYFRKEYKYRKARELLEAEAKYRSIFENAAEGIYQSTLDGRFTSANPAMAHILGYDSSEELMEGVTDIARQLYVNSTDRQQLIQRVEQHSVPSLIEVQLRRKDGRVIWTAANIRPVRDAAGNLVGLEGMIMDITERRHNEEQVRRQAKLLDAINRVLYETLQVSTEKDIAATCLDIALELTGSSIGFIGQVNAGGRFDTIAVNSPGWRLCHIPETHASVMIKDMVIRGIWGQVILRKQSLIVNDPLSHADCAGLPEDHPPLTSFLGTPLREGDDVIGMIAVANRDPGYTEDHKQDLEALSAVLVEAMRRKHIEMEMERLNKELERRIAERTAQLEAANKELEAFSYSVSHDLRAPLRSIDGFSRIVLEEYKDRLDDTGRHYLERVCRGVRQMELLIDDLLKLSRVTQVEKHDENIDLSGMVRAINEEQQRDNPDRAVEIVVQDGIVVRGDPRLMRDALENLINNAWKFTARTEQPAIEFVEMKKDGETVYFIKDNGVGFDMAYAHKLFGVFQRLHTTEEFPGTGVGLATVRRIIARHGGRIWAEGEVGKGAVFYFTLP